MDDVLNCADDIIARTRQLCDMVVQSANAQRKAEHQLERLRAAMQLMQPKHYKPEASVYDNVVSLLKLIPKS